MKTIKLIPEFAIQAGPNIIKLDGKKLIAQCLDNPPQGGFTLSVMRERNRISEALDALPEDASELELEDADAVVLNKCVEEMKWGIRNKNIVLFAEEVAAGAK